MDNEKDITIRDLKTELAKWRGRALEAAEVACQLCKHTNLDLCKHCRMEQIRKEAGH